MSSATELAFLTAAALSERIHRRDVKPSEVVGATLGRIAEVGPMLNCYGHVASERALAHAEGLDRLIAAGIDLGPLHGIPIAVKDCIDTAGMPTTAGSSILAGRRPTQDATAVQRLVRSGAVIIGKANLYEWAYGGPSTMWGEVANPWRLGHTAGASSNGSAALVAAGLAAGALGSDMGGSIRIPAAMCGVFGLKPTTGLVSRRGVIPPSSTLDHVGPMTRSAADAALLLDAMAGHDPLDPHTWGRRPPQRPDTAAPVAHMRVGIPRPQEAEVVSPPVAAALEQAQRVLNDAGCHLVEVDLPSYEDARTLFWAISAAENAETQRANLHAHPDAYDINVWELLTVGEFVPATEYVHAQRVRQLFSDRLSTVFSQVDALLMPVLPLAPWPNDQTVFELDGRVEHKMAVMTRYSPLFNLTGHPAASVPFGFTGDGLPLSVQLAAPLAAEQTIFRLAVELERANPERDRRPDLTPFQAPAVNL